MMDEKAKFALKRDIAKSYVTGEEWGFEMIKEAWYFIRKRGVTIQEMMGNLPPEAVRGLAEDAKKALKDVPDDLVDDERYGVHDLSVWPPIWPQHHTDPTFIPWTFVRELTRYAIGKIPPEAWRFRTGLPAPGMRLVIPVQYRFGTVLLSPLGSPLAAAGAWTKSGEILELWHTATDFTREASRFFLHRLIPAIGRTGRAAAQEWDLVAFASIRRHAEGILQTRTEFVRDDLQDSGACPSSHLPGFPFASSGRHCARLACDSRN
jgi:hypothetical protein